MNIDTITGLHGRLIAYRAATGSDHRSGWAILYRAHAAFPERPYSVHFIHEFAEYAQPGSLGATSGHYDLTLAEAQELFDRVCPLPTKDTL